MADESAPAPSAAPPTWRASLVSLIASEGYSLDPILAELSSENRPLFTVLDPEAVARESKDATVAEELKASGGVTPGIIAKALVAKLAEDKAAAVEAKTAAIAAAEAAAAEAKAAAEERAAKIAAGEEVEPEPEPEPEPEAAEGEGEGEGDTFKDAPPPVDRAADAYLVLKDFPRTAEDSDALAAAGLALDTLINLEMDSFGLAHANGAPPAEPAEGEEPLAPEVLPPAACLEALVPLVGAEGAGLEETALLTLGSSLAAESWADIAAVVAMAADVMYAPHDRTRALRGVHALGVHALSL